MTNNDDDDHPAVEWLKGCLGLASELGIAQDVVGQIGQKDGDDDQTWGIRLVYREDDFEEADSFLEYIKILEH